MPSEKQIEAAAKAMETLALEQGFVPWDEAASVALTAAEQAEPAPAAEPVAYPKIMYCCEHCSEHNPEMCGHDRRDIYVTNDGRWLCDECREEEGISSCECSSPPFLYTRPTEQAVTEAMVEAAQRIRDVAMRQTIAARVPECGEFGGIAQDADWLVDALKAAMEARHD